MAAFKHCKDLNDVALRPRLLRKLLNDHLPDSIHPFGGPCEVSSIVSTLKIHSLLTEKISPLTDPKVVSDWKSSFDAWVGRLLILCRSDSPDKSWAGVCLLGVTSTECSSARFLNSYKDWFNVLLSHIQSSGASQFVKVASCAAMSDLLTRLGGFSNQKEGNSYAGKLVQPIIKMLNEDVTESVSDVAAQLLLTILNYFPFSVQRYYDNAEGVIVSRIMSANCSAKLLKKLSYCLASLPKSKGDEGCWSLMMQKILLSLSGLLNNTLEGLEEETRRGEAVALLVQPGKDPPPSLGGKMMTGGTLNTGEWSQKMLISSISSLMQCCCILLTDSYPVQVAVPVCPLLAMTRRVLMVNGSLPENLQPFTTAMQQEFVCLQLPVLHLNVLEVLAAAIKGLRSQILPHAADIIDLLMKYLKTCQMPDLRTKVYSIIRALLVSMGAGLALYISREVIDNLTMDLKSVDSNYGGALSTEPSSVKLTQQSRPKKRKQADSEEQQASLCSELNDCQTSVSLKKSAIETLEALLVMGGALSCNSWRPEIDDLMIEVATSACKGGRTHDEKPFHRKDTRVVFENFQLVALRALLSSLLSPAGYRPPYLSKGLELFHKGQQNTGTKVAEFCSQALVSLEVLIHPRALPLIDTALPNGNSYSFGRTDFGGSKSKLPLNDGISTGHGNSHVVNDFLYGKYQEEVTVSEIPARQGVVQFDEKSLDFSSDQNHEEYDVAKGLAHNVMPMVTDEGSTPSNLGSKIASNHGRVMNLMMDVEHHVESNKLSLASVSREDDSIFPSSSFLSVRNRLENNLSDSKGITSTTEIENVVTAHADKNTLKMTVIEQDDELSDSFPDIVDADPDSDSDSE